MTKAQIHNLLSHESFPEATRQKELIETHISWVIICNEFVYKIKKPLQYSFLDFSTLALRKYFCEREVELNKRLTPDVYIGVEPVREFEQRIHIGGQEGTLIDYAIKMHKLEENRRMDILLDKNEVSKDAMKELAEIIASFHQKTTVIYEKDLLDIREKFNDLETEKENMVRLAGYGYGAVIDRAVTFSNDFLHKHSLLIATRLKEGFYRDGHGDLHSRNIFLLKHPVPFDCIEFNDDFRQIDVLNEVAFLCMDLEAFGRQDLSDCFLERYNHLFPTIKNTEDRDLFIYYKSYRANIRAKVNSLRAGSTTNQDDKEKALASAKKYLSLMERYLIELGMQ